MELTTKQIEHIDSLLKEFDTNVVRKAMKKLKWTWWDSDKVPTHGRILDQARKLLESAFLSTKKNYITGTGGLEVLKMDGFISLKFVATEVEECYE